MDFKFHIVRAWELTLKNIVSLLLLTLVMIGGSAVSLGILAPVLVAGYTQSILMLVRNGREPKMQDLFAHFKLFLPLLGFGFACALVTWIGFMLLLLPGVAISLGITFCCLYMIPLMTDRGLGLVDAVKESYRMATTGNMVEHAIVAIVFLGVTVIGGSSLIGSLFTQPLATVFLMSVYEERTGVPADPY
jgi:hypothetical protein